MNQKEETIANVNSNTNMTKFLFVFVIYLLYVEAQAAPENLKIDNPYQIYSNKPFIDGVWNSPERLQLCWYFGKIYRSSSLRGEIYRLTWKEYNVTYSDKKFIHVDANIKYKRELEIFSILSNGTNKF